MKRLSSFLLLLFLVAFFSSCDFLFGKKEDETVNEIFEQGAIDPDLYPDQVGYVPLLPFWEAIPNPVDVYVGYDEMVYVIDDNGVEIFDQKGTKQRTILIMEATDVMQDRRLHTFVCGKVDKVIDGVTYHLAAVFHLINASATDQ
ncbi:MAG: hypothetical protein ABIO46_09975, partial [Chitinophagales bacterium]